MKAQNKLKYLVIPLLLIKLIAANALMPDEKTVEALKPKLNSERIAYFFGNYHIEQLNVCSSVFPESRISNLYSSHDGVKIMRTLAIVNYVTPINPFLKTSHTKILAGTSIGIALRDAGWEVIKKPIYFGEIALSANVMKWMHEKTRSTGTIHIYQLEVKNDEHPTLIPYCTIIEIHSPQYLTNSWLKALNSKDFIEYQTANSNVNKLLPRIKKCLAEFPIPEIQTK